ncbi:CAP domain-containing protein [Sphingobacterium humi]|uniref:CAP domain-containing protein n=1 Tax=Sphingobacterium humi TaxID=1796905 RepID=A0A6N8L0A2_9SPHI|nr:CAP domain-containing protein [Sphingobacterium humi]MVZ63170.1 CAP domain-containing protein [Sphingobacterium humi]
MRYLLFAILLWAQPLFAQKNIRIDRGEAKEAYAYLNEIRQNPNKYRRSLQIANVQQVSRHQLVWNKTLAKVAEQRAYDMAKRNYFDHVTPEGIGPNYFINQGGYWLNPDWLKKKSLNNFESIGANHPTATEAIEAFIIGHGSPGKMHRKHLLGMDTWNGSLQDIGIGFVRVPQGSAYKTYICVLIAKHDW